MSTAMTNLREAVAGSYNLTLAYRRYARHRGLWEPGVPMAAVAASPLRAMLMLAEDLRSGRYRPHPPKIISIAKADGGRREIAVYMLRDRVAQRALLQVLQDRTDAAMSPFSFGYRPRRSVASALACVRSYLAAGYSWVGDADVQRCFDTIPHAPLLAEVERRLDNAASPKLVAQFLGWKRKERRTGTGIPQGSGLAPWLCNVYLWRLDDHMADYGVPMVRYADDFVVLAKTKGGAKRALGQCAAALDALLLRLHPVKTRIVHALMPIRFLGQWLGPKPGIGGTRGPIAEGAPCC